MLKWYKVTAKVHKGKGITLVFMLSYDANFLTFALQMEYNTHTLANGLRVIHLPSASPVVYCGYEVNAGTRDERPEEEGIAHFCEHVSFKGTARRRAWHVLNCLEKVGGELNAYTNKEDTVYYAAILRQHLPRAVDLLTDIVFHSTYPQPEIDKEVEVICDEIESYNDSPSELIYDEFENMVFRGHPLGHNILGKADRLRRYTTSDALAFTRRYYQPSNSVFFAYGDIDFSRLVRMLERATSDFPSCAPRMDDAVPADSLPAHQPLPEYCPQTVDSGRGTHQAHVMLGNRAFGVHDRRRIPLYLLNNILGGPGMNARLNLALRERNGLVYTVESTMVSYSDTGVWSVYFGCDPADVPRCLRLVHRELTRMADAPLTEAQLLAAKRQITGQVSIACDNRESFALDFGKSFLHYGWEKDVEALIRSVGAVTAEQLREVAETVFAEESLTTLIYH